MALDDPGIVPERVRGEVYFIGSQDGPALGPVKIGFSRNTYARFDALQCGSPLKLSILLILPGSAQDEKAYHRQFAAYRLHGEWFFPHRDLLRFVRRQLRNSIGVRPDILAEISRLSMGARQ